MIFSYNGFKWPLVWWVSCWSGSGRVWWSAVDRCHKDQFCDCYYACIMVLNVIPRVCVITVIVCIMMVIVVWWQWSWSMTVIVCVMTSDHGWWHDGDHGVMTSDRGVMTVIMVWWHDGDHGWWQWSWCDDEWSWFDNGDCDVMTVTLPSVYVTRCRHFTNSSRTFMTSTRSTAGRDRISRRTSWFVSLENVVMSVEHRYCQYVLNCMLFFLFKYVDLCSARKLYNYCVHLVCNMHHWTSVTG